MNVSESIISSFFVHSIAIFILLAITSYNSGTALGNRALSVDLSAPFPGREAEDRGQKTPVHGETAASRPEKTAEQTAAAEEPVEKPEPEKAPELPSQDPPAQKPDAAAQTRDPGGKGPEAAHEGGERSRLSQSALIFHVRMFVENTGMKIQDAVFSEVRQGGTITPEGLAKVRLYYGEKGALLGFDVLSDSDDLKALLERVSWSGLPVPADYFLRYKGLEVTIAVIGGNPYIYMAFL